MSVSSSTGKVSWKRTELNLWIKTLICWNKSCTSSGSPVRSGILRPRSTRNETDETLARVSQLPLAETHKLLTVPCISDASCQQLVRQRLLLHGLQQPSMNRPLWCRLWHTKPVVYLCAEEWGRSHLGVFHLCEPTLAPSLLECPLCWRRGWHTRLGRDASPLGWEHIYTRNHACPSHQLNCSIDISDDCWVQSPALAQWLCTWPRYQAKACKQWLAMPKASRHYILRILPGNLFRMRPIFEQRSTILLTSWATVTTFPPNDKSSRYPIIIIINVKNKVYKRRL